MTDIIKTIAAFAGKDIDLETGEVTERTRVHSSEVTKTEMEHDYQTFFCVGVPGKAFHIKSGDLGDISVTGNTLHCNNIIRLFRTFIEEHPRIWNDDLKKQIYEIAETAVVQEDAFIDLAFEMGGVQGLEPDEVKQYIRYIADRRLIQLGMKNIFKQKTNPLPWVDEMTTAPEHANFFEARATEYTKASTTGSWDDAFDFEDDFKIAAMS